MGNEYCIRSRWFVSLARSHGAKLVGEYDEWCAPERGFWKGFQGKDIKANLTLRPSPFFIRNGEERTSWRRPSRITGVPFAPGFRSH